MYQELKKKIEDKKAHIGVVGLGYVGLPLAVEFAREGFKVTGLDLNEKRVKQLLSGKSYIPDVSTSVMSPLVKDGFLTGVTDYKHLKKADVIIICVPTPLRKTREPDVSYIVGASMEIQKIAHKGQLIVLESTTYPGSTEEILKPLFEDVGLKLGKDVFLAFSPERIDPGNPHYQTRDIPKVVGGVTPRCSEMAQLLYSQIICKVVSVSSPATAEMVKLLENTFRSVNIGLANEMALLCDRFGIDVWEVIEGAKTKPFGFMPFYPGPGLGGHCIPCDPIYLSWKARSLGFEARFIELASQVNSFMPRHVVDKVVEHLNSVGKSLKGAKILVLGVAYKADVNDTRDTPADEILVYLRERGGIIQYHDPFVPSFDLSTGEKLRSVPLTPGQVKSTDCVVVVTDHHNVDYDMVCANAKLLVDTRNVYRKRRLKKIRRL
ncbi:MAG: nucleotide sugar dehydrogenase [Candidatus Omnitrophica bacterium]|nr:nucleotide sugar dehydrogenase [Candidatus Omnitrophota bacterium]